MKKQNMNQLLIGLSLLALLGCAGAEYHTSIGGRGNGCVKDCIKVIDDIDRESGQTGEEHQLRGYSDVLDIVIVSSRKALKKKSQLKDEVSLFIDSLDGLDWRIGVAPLGTKKRDLGKLYEFSKIVEDKRIYLKSGDSNTKEKLYNALIEKPSCTFFCSGRQPVRAAAQVLYKASSYNRDFFRKDSDVVFAFFTDHTGRDTTGVSKHLSTIVLDKLGRGRLYSAYGAVATYPQGNCWGSNDNLKESEAVIRLARGFGGELSSICNQDISASLQGLVDRIGRTSRYIALKHRPRSIVAIAVEPAQDVKWSLHGQNVVFDRHLDAGTKVTIKYKTKSRGGFGSYKASSSHSSGTISADEGWWTNGDIDPEDIEKGFDEDTYSDEKTLEGETEESVQKLRHDRKFRASPESYYNDDQQPAGVPSDEELDDLASEEETEDSESGALEAGNDEAESVK